MSEDIGHISTGRAPIGVPVPALKPISPSPIPSAPAPRQSTPVPPPPTKPISAPASQPTIIVPEASEGSGGSSKWLYIGSAVLLFVAGYFGFSLISGGSNDTPTPTPSPSVSVTPTPIVKTLRTYFGAPSQTIDLKDGTAQTDFTNGFVTAQPSQKQVANLAITRNGSTASASDFIKAVLPAIPTDLTVALGSDMAVMAFGQTEAFDASGGTLATANPAPRLAIVIELSDTTKASGALSAWHSTIINDAKQLFAYDPSKAIVTSFSTGMYRQNSIQYWNFPYADYSIDYAIVLASNGKSYLVMTGSRESIHFVIDQLMQ